MNSLLCSALFFLFNAAQAAQQALPEDGGGPLAGLKQAGTVNFVVLAGLLFVVGMAGVLTRRNIIVIFMSIELMLNAANLNFIAFARYWQLQGSLTAANGQMFTLFVIVVAAAEAAIGLALILAHYRNRKTVEVDEIDLLKW